MGREHLEQDCVSTGALMGGEHLEQDCVSVVAELTWRQS